MSGAEWKIQRHGTRCHATDREFEEGETFYSAIFWTEGELERRDYCVEAWKARFGAPSEGADDSPEADAPEADAPEARPFSFWRTRLPRSDEPPRIAFQEAEDCFWQLVEPPKLDAETRSLAFVLSLLLLRKKKIRLESTERRRGREVSRFRSLDGERTIELADPGLEADDIERLERQVRALLFPGLVTDADASADGPSDADEPAAADISDRPDSGEPGGGEPGGGEPDRTDLPAGGSSGASEGGESGDSVRESVGEGSPR